MENQKQITENNKLLAEFLGFELTTDSISILYYTEDRGLKQLPKFNSDWNWLMQVVEKIEDENFKDEAKNCVSFLIKIVNTDCQIVDIFKDRFEINIYGNTKIEAVYNACVEFVKWYNEQK